MAFLCAQGQDILMDKESFKLGSKFANKIWNASRYILMNLEGRNLVKDPPLIRADRWIPSRLNRAAGAMAEAFLSYRYNDAAQTAYEYFWNDFCDWYVEATKLSMWTGDDAEKDRAATVLLEALAASLRLLHPLLPFVTEEIYGTLPEECRAGAGLLITAPYPVYDESRTDAGVEREFAFLQELVRMVRTLRSECTISPEKKLRVLARLPEDRAAILGENAELVKLLAGIGELETQIRAAASAPGGPEAAAGDRRGDAGGPARAAEGRRGDAGGEEHPRLSIGLAGQDFEAFVFIADAVDPALLKQKFVKEIEKDRKFIEGLKAKLNNEKFLQNAPPELVAAEREKLGEALRRTEKLDSYMRNLS
jgi:valyl-tRNA synthetase